MSRSRMFLDDEVDSAEGVFNTLTKQFNNVFKEKFNKISTTDAATKNAARNLFVSIANHGKLGKIQNISTKHVNMLVQDMQEAGYTNKNIKDTVSRLQDLTRRIGTKKPLVPSKEIFKMNGVGNREDVRLERQWSDAEYNGMINEARKAGREDVILAFKTADAFCTRLEGTFTLSPSQIERALLHGELVVTEKGGKTRHIKVETNKQKKLLKEYKKIYEKEKLPMNAKIFRDSEFLNQNKKIKNQNSVGKCMRSAQNFIYNHRDDVQDKDRVSLKDREGNGIEKPDLSFHGLRYRGARETYIRKRLGGLSSSQAFKYVNKHLGHGADRKDITEIYLKNMESDFVRNLEFYREKYNM